MIPRSLETVLACAAASLSGVTITGPRRSSRKPGRGGRARAPAAGSVIGPERPARGREFASIHLARAVESTGDLVAEFSWQRRVVDEVLALPEPHAVPQHSVQGLPQLRP